MSAYHTDAQFYSAILKADLNLFTGLASELARGLMEDRIEYVAGPMVPAEPALKD